MSLSLSDWPKRSKNDKDTRFLLSLMFLSHLFADECSVSMKRFGELGWEAFYLSAQKANGMTADITNYGGIVTRLLVPDRLGRVEDVVLAMIISKAIWMFRRTWLCRGRLRESQGREIR